MMYIEHTPLEDNLQYILKNHVSASDASSILAHVRDSVGTEASTQLQLRVRAEGVACAYAGAIDSLRVDAGSHAAAKGARPKANYFPAKQLRAETPRLAVPPVTNGNANVEEEEECDYELIDIDDGEVEQEEQASKLKQEFQNTTNNYIEYRESAAKHPNEAPNTASSGEFIIEIEEETDSQAYILTRAPKTRQDSPLKSGDEICTEQPLHCVSERQPEKRALRPVPAAIPIQNIQPPRQFLRRGAQKPWRRILNGNLPLIQSQRRSESFSSYHLEDDEFDLVRGRESVNDFNETAAEDDYYLPEIVPDYAHNSQMGIDIFGKLRRFLSTGSDSTRQNREEESRKRSGNWTSDVNPHPIKYRKVQNHFPKIITHALEDDDFDMTTFPRREKSIPFISTGDPGNAPEMTQRKSMHSVEQQKCRKSMFLPPSFTNKIVRNTSYADVEFSDDDEPEFVQSFGVGAVGGAGTRSERGTLKIPQVFNVPIVREDRAAMSATKIPPPLIEARTGSILATSLMPQIDLTKRKPMSYSEVLRQSPQFPSSGGNVLNRRPASSISSSAASTSASMGGMNMLGNVNSNMWSTNARSILALEKETKEHERYQQLLEQVVPCLYGSSDGSNFRQMAGEPINVDAPPRRRSALLNITSNTVATNKSLMASQRKSALENNWQQSLKRPPLSSTINLDDEDDENDDVTFTNVMQLKHRPVRNGVPTVIIDDDEISEIIDLDEEERQVVSACSKIKQDSAFGVLKEKKKSDTRLPYVEPVNTLQERFKTSPHLKDNWLETLHSKWTEKKKSRLQEVKETVNVVQKLTAERRAAELEMHERLRKIQIIDPELLVIDDFPEPVVEEEPEFIELTPDHQARIKAAICGPPDQVLVSKFNLNITRRDIHTLLGHNWLNDEVINFYMNLLTERGEKKHESHGLPTVYAMNTFFVPRLLSAGHSGVKRWTRKVDIFSKDIIPVPVHVGGVHWCMAIIHLKDRTIKYYDSMGTPNPNVLKALEQYLKDESMDKRKQPYDTSHFEVESVRDVPRQMNGSDCGVFSCMFAEYITRNREITFSQQHMEYFRHKMVLEIVRGELLH